MHPFHTFMLQQPRACSQQATAHREKGSLPHPNAITVYTKSTGYMLAYVYAFLLFRWLWWLSALISAIGNPEEKQD